MTPHVFDTLVAKIGDSDLKVHPNIMFGNPFGSPAERDFKWKAEISPHIVDIKGYGNTPLEALTELDKAFDEFMWKQRSDS